VAKVGRVAGLISAPAGKDLILLSNAGKMLRVKVEEIPLLHRSTQGVKLIDLEPEERVAGIVAAEREAEMEKLEEETPADELGIFDDDEENPE
jgi:DNA gyrase subunit A